MNRIILPLLLVLVCAAELLLAAEVSAQHAHTKDAVRVEVHGTLSRWGGIGAGARAEMVVAPEGVIPNLDDDISITAGGEVLFFDFNDNDGYIHVHRDGYRHDHGGGGVGIWPGLAAQWNFYLGRNWSLFPELGLWLYFGSGSYHDNYGNNDNFGWSLMGGFGGRYHMAGRNALMLRIQFPGLLQFGVTF